MPDRRCPFGHRGCGKLDGAATTMRVLCPQCWDAMSAKPKTNASGAQNDA